MLPPIKTQYVQINLTMIDYSGPVFLAMPKNATLEEEELISESTN